MLRFFTYASKFHPPAKLGLAYLQAIRKAAIPCRAIALNAVDLSDLGDPWSDVVDMFAVPLEDDFVNVFCAPPGDVITLGGQRTGIRLAEALYTGGHTNIAIVGGSTRDLLPVVPALLRFDQVLAPTDHDVISLMAAGIHGALLVEPTLYPILAWHCKLKEWGHLCA